MSGEQYTQIKRPVSRLTEKILGWFSWVFLLILTIVTMFIALVSFSNDTSIANLESSLNSNELIQQILGNNHLSTTQFVIWLQNGVWAIIVYFIVCLLISFLALISMNIRILSGILFLLAAVVTIPLVLLVVTLIIPILFFIIAIMMFARRDRLETVPAYYGDEYGHPYHDDRDYYDQRRPQSSPREDDYYEYEQPRDNKEYRNTRRQRRKERQQREAYEAEQQYEPQKRDGYVNDSEGYRNEELDDKYSQFPKRAVESEYNSAQQTEEEPAIMSRQAKYNKKSKKSNREDSIQENHYQDRDYNGNEYEDGYYQELQEPQIDPKEQKAQLKKEKAEIRAKKREKKKAYNKRMKERRKNQPSAVNQRRMNYEERRQMSHNDSTKVDAQENHEELDDSGENK